MSLIVSCTRMAGRAAVWVGGIDLEDMFIHVIAVWVMQVSFVQIVDVAFVCDTHMAAGWAMLVSMLLMPRASAHIQPPVPARFTACSCVDT